MQRNKVWTTGAAALLIPVLLGGCPQEEEENTASFPEPLAEEQVPPGFGGEVPDDAEYPCMVKRTDGICNSTSAFALPHDEIEVDAAAPRPTGDAEYPRLLSEALGFDGPRLAEVARGETRHYGVGTITEIRAHYDVPAVALRALYAQRPEAQDIVLIVHGLGSSPDKVMGLDHEDYMRRVGQVLFERGRDVLALAATTNAVLGTRANARLRFYGTTIHGLHTRALCDMAYALKLRERYNRVIVYGLSNGAWISRYAGSLCEPFSLVIVDDGGGSWRSSIWADPDGLQSDLKYGMFIRYLRPLYEQTSLVAPLMHARSPLVWIGNEREFDGWREEAPRLRLSRGVDSGHVRLVFKKRDMHVPEIHGLILPLLESRTEELDGYTLG